MKFAATAAVVAAFMAVLLAIGFYIGMTWANGRHNARDLAATRSQLDATQNVLDQSQANWQRALADFRTDSAALNATAQEYAHERETQAAFGRSLSARLDAALAARPDLAACDVGPDGLRIWNDANRGNTAATAKPAAAANARPKPAAAVPGAATGAERAPAGAGEKPPARHDAVSRLRGPTSADHRRGAPAAGDRGAARGASRLALITGEHE